MNKVVKGKSPPTSGHVAFKGRAHPKAVALHDCKQCRNCLLCIALRPMRRLPPGEQFFGKQKTESHPVFRVFPRSYPRIRRFVEMTLVSDKHEEIKHAAEELFATKPGLDEVLPRGHGPARAGSPGVPHAWRRWPSSSRPRPIAQIHRMVAELRKVAPPKDLAEETQVITVRIPKSMHEALRIEAFEHHTTMNKLCISKLLQFIDAENVPPRSKRKPAGDGSDEEEKESEVGL